MCLTARLNAPFGGNLAPGYSAEVLAREFNDGLAGLLSCLALEAAGNAEKPPPRTIHELLMEVWTRPGDDIHLKTATGKTREEWLAAPLWAVSA